MTQRELIRKTLFERGVDLVGDIISDSAEVGVYFAAIVIRREDTGRQSPPNALLDSIRQDLKANGISLHFLLRYEGAEQVEPGLRATLLHSHIQSIRNVFASIEGSNVIVWIEPKARLTGDVVAQLKARSTEFLSLFGLKLAALSLTRDEVLPSKFAMLSEIRSGAPMSPETLKSNLEKRGFVVPSLDYINRQADALRKSGDVVRLSTGKLALTKRALHNLGTKKNRESPDIKRLLALAKGER